MGKEVLAAAQIKKNDEFYTKYEDVEKELQHYQDKFDSKVVYCNCDNSNESNFVKYFLNNFENLKLSKLIATCYNPNNGGGVKLIKTSTTIHYSKLSGDGDFRSDECVELLKESDVIVTNPPFSLFREYLKQLIDYDKKFLIIGGQNAITYKEVFKLIQDNIIWLGTYSGHMDFRVPQDSEPRKSGYWEDDSGQKWRSLGNITWFTNLKHDKMPKPLELTKEYTPEAYPKYDNCDAIEVSKVANIPKDYDGLMGVPITFLGKYNSNQFKIIRFRKGDDGKDLSINGNYPYFRILVKKLLYTN